MSHLAITNATEVKPRDQEVSQGRLRTLSEIEQILRNPDFIIEGWSEIAFKPLRKILI